jgi:thymidylate kinase
MTRRGAFIAVEGVDGSGKSGVVRATRRRVAGGGA